MSEVKERLQGWLHDLGALAGVPVTLGQDGAAEMELAAGGSVQMDLDEEVGLLLLSADLFAPTSEQRMAVFEQALQMNCRQVGTQGATLGWDADRDLMVLSAIWPVAAMDEEAFLSLLSGFIEMAQRFRNGLMPEVASAAFEISGGSAGTVALRG